MGTDGSNDTRETRIGPLPTGLCVDTAKVNAYVTGLGNILSTVLTFIGLWIASAGREGPSESHATSSFKQQFKNSIQAIEIIA